MRCLFYICALFLALPKLAAAQTASECRLQTDPQMRLACYDKVFPLANGLPTQETPQFSYSWTGIQPCRTLANAPAFVFLHVPEKARIVSLVLTQGPTEFGGQQVSLPLTGIIPEGTVRTRSPCNPGVYRWTAVLMSASGEVLTTIEADRRFPAE